jgi:hypothetical protein
MPPNPIPFDRMPAAPSRQPKKQQLTSRQQKNAGKTGAFVFENRRDGLLH